jgi:guanylate kinase
MTTMAPLVIVSGPSGCGKTTIIRRLLDEMPWIRLSVSVTTRAPRINEQPGVHYHYWNVPEFIAARDKGRFLEWAEVHGNYYGTLEDEVTPYRRDLCMGVVLDIDVQGAEQVKKRCPDAVSIFVHTTRFETLEERLRARHTEPEEVIQRRLTNARAELARAGEYDYQVINDDLESALASMRGILGPLFQRSQDA